MNDQNFASGDAVLVPVARADPISHISLRVGDQPRTGIAWAVRRLRLRSGAVAVVGTALLTLLVAVATPAVGAAPEQRAIPKEDRAKETLAFLERARLTGAKGSRVQKRLLKSTVLILSQFDAPGVGIFMGTGTLIDKTNRLVLTSRQVVEGSSEVFVFFPIYKDGRMISGREPFLRAFDSRKDVLKGEMLEKQASCDLALVKLDKLPADVESLPLGSARPEIGQSVYLVGHGGRDKQLWDCATGAIRSFSHRKEMVGEAAGAFQLDADVVVTTLPARVSDGGAPVVNSRGEVVAVAQKTRRGDALSTAVDVKEVRAFLDRCGARRGIKFDLPKGPAVGDDRAWLTDITRCLKDGDARVRRVAASVLGDWGADAKMPVPDLISALDEAVPAVLNCLRDGDAKVRAEAARTLGKIGAKRREMVVRALSDLKKDDPSPEVRAACQEALAMIGQK
jgi:S1-C subfamily serine protease